ncbi:hypothetical protein GCM10028784_06340 [Myceligenerans cantabricum]
MPTEPAERHLACDATPHHTLKRNVVLGKRWGRVGCGDGWDRWNSNDPSRWRVTGTTAGCGLLADWLRTASLPAPAAPSSRQQSEAAGYCEEADVDWRQDVRIDVNYRR